MAQTAHNRTLVVTFNILWCPLRIMSHNISHISQLFRSKIFKKTYNNFNINKINTYNLSFDFKPHWSISNFEIENQTFHNWWVQEINSRDDFPASPFEFKRLTREFKIQAIFENTGGTKEYRRYSANFRERFYENQKQMAQSLKRTKEIVLY